jgi:hypothetical protein
MGTAAAHATPCPAMNASMVLNLNPAVKMDIILLLYRTHLKKKPKQTGFLY